VAGEQPVPKVERTKPISLAPSVEPVKGPLPAVEKVVKTPLPAVDPKSGKAPLPLVEPKPGRTPAQLPSSVMEGGSREEPSWEPNPEPSPASPGTWAPSAPAQGPAPLPTKDPTDPWGQTSRARVGPVVARGQFTDNAPDSVAALIKQVCEGRAENVEVRWTGAKKLSVCFEIRTAPAAQKLVNDISKRPELTAYQIDYCVLVK
jgi:hypothetical protein